MKSLFVALASFFFIGQFPTATGTGLKTELVVQTGHTSSVKSVAFSPDGRLLATAGGWDNSVKLWDVASGREVRTLTGHTGPVNAVAFNPDGHTLASGGDDRVIKIWDVTSGRALETLSDNLSFVQSLSYSPDGKSLASGCDNSVIDNNEGSLKVWDFGSRKVRTLLRVQYHGFKVVEFSPDGRTIAASNSDSSVSLLDAVSGSELRTFTGHTSDVRALTFSPDGKRLATGSMDKTVKVWDVESARLIRTLEGHEDSIWSVAISRDGRTLASGGEDKGIRTWNLQTGEPAHILNIRFGQVQSLKFSPNGALASGGDEVDLWDVGSGENIRPFASAASAVRKIAFSSDGLTLASANGDRSFKLWDFGSGQGFSSTEAQSEAVSAFALDLFRSRNVLASGMYNGAVKLRDVEQKTGIRTLQGHKADIKFLAASPDGRTLASIEDDFVMSRTSIIKIWDVDSSKEIHTLPEQRSGITSVTFSPDGKTLAVADMSNAINLWDVGSGRKLFTLNGHTSPVACLAFSRDGSLLATGDGPAVSIQGGVLTGGHAGAAAIMAEVTLSSAMSSGEIYQSDHAIKIWDVRKGVEVSTLLGHTLRITSVAFSPDGATLASMSADNTIRLWDAYSGREIKSYQAQSPTTALEVFRKVPALYRDSGSELVSPDGAVRLKIAENGKIQLYDMRSGRHLATLIALGAADWVVVTPDGRFDTNKLDDPQGLQWVVQDAPLTPLSFEVFMRDYFEPKLLPRLLKCTKENDCDREFKAIRDLSSLNRTQPKVRIIGITPTASPDVVEVSVEAGDVISEYQKDARGRRLSSGVYDVRLFRDGQLVGHTTSDEKLQSAFRSYRNSDEELAAWRESHRVELADGKRTFTLQVTLPRRPDDRQVEFSAYAFNEDRVKSETYRALYTIPAAVARGRERRTAFLVSVGINKYENARWDLRFAGDDARVMLGVISATLRKGGDFAEVVEVPLISDDESDGSKTVERRDATKANVRAVLGLLAGKTPSAELLEGLEKAIGPETLRKIRRSSPDDLLLVSFSSHGYADKNGVFYIMPTDIGRGGGRSVTESLLRRSISSDELSLWLQDVDAGEMLMIVDACHATSAVEGSEFKPGPMGSRGLGQLAFDKGMKILTATQADNVALENKLIRQGLLTYALIRDGIESRRADFKPKDKIIGVSEWLSYGVERVPKLYEELQAGKIKDFGGGAGRQTKAVITARQGRNYGRELKEVLAAARTQQPSLFDFTRKKKEVILSALE